MEISSKALISSILSSTLLISNLATPALAAGTSKVTLNIETTTPEVVSVKVPTEIPITLKNNGDIEVPQDLKITNLSSTTAVKAESIQVEGLNGWSVKDYSTDFTSKPENTQELGLQLRGDNSDDSGNINLTPNNWVIAEDSTLPLNAKAKLPTQNREQSDVGEIAQVNYTFAIADDGEESHSITNDWDKSKVVKDSVTPVTFDIYSTSPDTHIVSVESSNAAVTIEKVPETYSAEKIGSEVWNVKANNRGISTVTATLNTGETTTFTVNVYELNIPDGGDSGIEIELPDKKPGDNLETGDITIDIPIKNPDGSDGTITVTPEIPDGTPPLVEGENNINIDINIDINISINIDITINVSGGQQPSEQFTVTYITDGNGSVSEDSRKFNSGSNLTFPTATPNEGYVFDKWVDTTTDTEVTGNTLVNSNMEVKAVFVEEPEEVVLESIEVTKQPDKVEYTEGENFNSTGMEITAHYSDGSIDIVYGWTVLDGDNLTVGKNTITVQYSEGGINKECTVNITVNEAEPEVIEIELTVDNKALLGIDGTETELDLSVPIEGTDGKLYKVIAIGNDVFKFDRTLCKLKLSDDVTRIGDNALYALSLEDVNIPSNLQYIGDYAFSSTKISSVTIPTTVTYIGEYAFFNCSNLSTVNLPSNMQEIPVGMFNNCKALEYIEIPESVTRIHRVAFNQSGLREITLGENINITADDSHIFTNCTNLSSVTFNCRPTIIPTSMFSGCASITNINIPNSVTELGMQAFMNCTGFTEFTIPTSVKTIGQGVFWGCTNISELHIPSSVTKIDYLAFENVPHIYYTGSASGSPWGALAIN